MRCIFVLTLGGPLLVATVAVIALRTHASGVGLALLVRAVRILFFSDWQLTDVLWLLLWINLLLQIRLPVFQRRLIGGIVDILLREDLLSKRRVLLWSIGQILEVVNFRGWWQQNCLRTEVLLLYLSILNQLGVLNSSLGPLGHYLVLRLRHQEVLLLILQEVLQKKRAQLLVYGLVEAVILLSLFGDENVNIAGEI